MLQHLLTKYGDRFIQSVKSLSERLNLSLDGTVEIQPTIAKSTMHAVPKPDRKITPTMHAVPKPDRKITPAKYDAWKMWHEDGLSFQKIAVSSQRRPTVYVINFNALFIYCLILFLHFFWGCRMFLVDQLQ